jgi:glycyl-tRNA synthetase beta chain
MPENSGFRRDIVKAVMAAGSDDVTDVAARADAVNSVLHMPEFLAIAAACKRMRNILKQAKEKGFHISADFDYSIESAEEAKMLDAKARQMSDRVEQDRAKKNYLNALIMLSTLREDVDHFFDKVMVMVDNDDRVRANRLALLQTLCKEFSTIADFSEIVTEGKT